MSEEYRPDKSIYNGMAISEDPVQEAAKLAAQRERRARLPKFELREGEEFYISESELKTINDNYFQMIDDMKEGFNCTSEEMRSFMQSVVFASYKSKIEKMQRDAAEIAIPKNVIKSIKDSELMPGYRRKWFLGRKRPNQSLELCQRQAGIEIAMEYSARQEEITRQEEYLYGAPTETDELLSVFAGTLPKRKRKKWFKRYGEDINRMLQVFMIQAKQNAERAAQEALEKALKEAESEMMGEDSEEESEEAPEAREQCKEGPTEEAETEEEFSSESDGEDEDQEPDEDVEDEFADLKQFEEVSEEEETNEWSEIEADKSEDEQIEIEVDLPPANVKDTQIILLPQYTTDLTVGGSNAGDDNEE